MTIGGFSGVKKLAFSFFEVLISRTGKTLFPNACETQVLEGLIV